MSEEWQIRRVYRPLPTRHLGVVLCLWHIVVSEWQLWSVATFARVATRWQLRSGSRGAGDEASLGDAPGWSQRFARKAVHGRQPARNTFAPPNPSHQPARERRPLFVLLRLLHSQLGRNYSIRYRSEVVAVYNRIVIQQCRPLSQEPGAEQSLVCAAQGGRCAALPAPCGAPLP